MNFVECEAYLKNLLTFGMKLGLQRMEELMARLDHPEKKIKTVHVTGTNGKGSVTAFISSILQAAGYKVGMFTSPHLHTFTDRIRINGRNIPDEIFAALLTELKAVIDPMTAEGIESPTEFEVITALALLYFAREQVDFAVMEVGLGGRLDSTNVIQPLVAVFTPISFDHMAVLGNTLNQIAAEKAGILKPGCIAVTARQPREAAAVIEQKAWELSVRLLQAEKDFTFVPEKMNLAGQTFTYNGLFYTFQRMYTKLLGRHQVENAAVAIAAIEALRLQKIFIPPPAVLEGISAARWAGRLELMPETNPYVLIDGAHNKAGAETLRDALLELFPGKKIVLLFGILADKQVDKVVGTLFPLAQGAVLLRPDNPRALDPRELLTKVCPFVPEAVVAENIEEGLRRAKELAGPNGVVCACGSLYLIGHIRAKYY